MAHQHDIEDIAATVAKINPKCRNPLMIAERYYNTVKQNIINGLTRVNPEQAFLDLFPISLKTLQLNCGKFKPGNQYYFKLLHQHHPLFKEVNKGSNLTGKQTVATTDIPIDILLAGANSEEVIAAIYKDITPETEFDFVDINISNLKNYINKVKATYKSSESKLKNLRDAGLILLIAQANNGVLPQVVNESAFGRRYYKGLNLQSCSKEVRLAALGSCWGVDISNSVFSWRYSMSHAEMQPMLKETRTYLLDKDRIRKKLAYAVFKNVRKDSIDNIKRVMTAISFGARGETNCWYRSNTGAWIQGSISQIITSPALRKELFAFVDHEFSMPQFMVEQECIAEYLVKHKFKEQRKDPAIREKCLTESGKRISDKKLLSMMYQQDERMVMEHLDSWSNSKRLLMVHDGAYYATKPDLLSMKSELKQFWFEGKLDFEQVDGWNYVEPALIEEESGHKKFMAQLEREANNGADPVTTGIHTEKLAAKVYNPHAEPDWVSEQMKEYYEHFPEPDPNMPDFARRRLQ